MDHQIRSQIEYLLRLTDKVGLIEHSHLDTPNLDEGYTVDDNARALQISLIFQKQFPVLKDYIPLYFNFINRAFFNNTLHNDLNKNQHWQKVTTPFGEHYGRSLLALAHLNTSSSQILFQKIYKSLSPKISPHLRLNAQIIAALSVLKNPDISLFADYLLTKFNGHWFEPKLTYDNFRLPWSLFIAYQSTSHQKYLTVALSSLDFLTQKMFDSKNNHFNFIGNSGLFGQQPIEAGSAIEAYSQAFLATQNISYYQLAQAAFNWFHGQNILKKSLLNPKTGGVYDGLEKTGPNLNQGAESVLAYLSAFNSFTSASKLLPSVHVNR